MHEMYIKLSSLYSKLFHWVFKTKLIKKLTLAAAFASFITSLILLPSSASSTFSVEDPLLLSMKNEFDL